MGDESSGSDYAFLDETALPGVTYYYWLQELEWTGATSIYGPITGRIPGEDPGSGVPTNVFIPIVATQR